VFGEIFGDRREAVNATEPRNPAMHLSRRSGASSKWFTDGRLQKFGKRQYVLRLQKPQRASVYSEAESKCGNRNFSARRTKFGTPMNCGMNISVGQAVSLSAPHLQCGVPSAHKPTAPRLIHGRE
jgi:hypothetical protein